MNVSAIFDPAFKISTHETKTRQNNYKFCWEEYLELYIFVGMCVHISENYQVYSKYVAYLLLIPIFLEIGPTNFTTKKKASQIKYLKVADFQFS